ncbi:hypothetical protein C8A03DRAFT_19432 [Achaetomium macrosporum]|uniref:Uncharacterized protein n=1 Tax=Achaetomium macrosporum TaxID=79813 RepID=A0AAN7C1I6_9PEZI|nr:hypothetical protein C8A03DRAFT_19432 [Achaetomium macrosporum]
MTSQESQEEKQASEQKQLWEINEDMINNNYKPQATGDGRVYYTLTTKRNDLPGGFWRRVKAVATREEAERIASSSGNWARNARQAGGTNSPNYQLLFQQIANNPNLGLLTSSAEAVKTVRKKKKKQRTKHDGLTRAVVFRVHPKGCYYSPAFDLWRDINNQDTGTCRYRSVWKEEKNGEKHRESRLRYLGFTVQNPGSKDESGRFYELAY